MPSLSVTSSVFGVPVASAVVTGILSLGMLASDFVVEIVEKVPFFWSSVSLVELAGLMAGAFLIGRSVCAMVVCKTPFFGEFCSNVCSYFFSVAKSSLVKDTASLQRIPQQMLASGWYSKSGCSNSWRSDALRFEF